MFNELESINGKNLSHKVEHTAIGYTYYLIKCGQR